ncbi:MAG: hypothetical protein AAB497_02545 [Patescibacteria group bacterium]
MVDGVKKVLVSVVKTVQGYLGTHGDWHWDANRYWKYYPAYIVTISAEGLFSWGPYKYRENSRKEHSGFAKVNVSDGWIFASEKENSEATKEDWRELKNKAEEFALDLATEMENNGFAVEFVFLEDNETSFDLRKKIKIDRFSRDKMNTFIEKEVYSEKTRNILKHMSPV